MRLAFFGVSGPVAAADDSHVSFLVELSGSQVLVDCSGTPSASLAAVGSSLGAIDIVVLTHAHTDHLYAFPSLIHAAWVDGRQEPLRIVSNSSTRQRAEQLLDAFGLREKKGMFRLEWLTSDEGELAVPPGVEQVGGLLRWFPVEHGVPTLGIHLEDSVHRVVYGCDTAPIERVRTEARQCSMLIHECSGADRDRQELLAKGHTSARQAGELARSAGVAELVLVHLPPRGRAGLREEAARAFEGRVTIPEPCQWVSPASSKDG